LQGACNDDESTIARREDATIKFLYLVNLNDGSNVPTFLHHIARSDDNKQWLIVTKGYKIAPSNAQPNLIVASRERAMIAE
jgi:hypothetical protein